MSDVHLHKLYVRVRVRVCVLVCVLLMKLFDLKETKCM